MSARWLAPTTCRPPPSAQLRYHDDFDWPRLRIGNMVMRQFGASPWRYATCDYLAAMETAAHVHDKRSLGSAPPDAHWDATLVDAMLSFDRAIDEEAIADSLLPDLAIAAHRA